MSTKQRKGKGRPEIGDELPRHCSLAKRPEIAEEAHGGRGPRGRVPAEAEAREGAEEAGLRRRAGPHGSCGRAEIRGTARPQASPW